MSKVKEDSKHIKLLKANFVAFLFVLWAALALPIPTKQQIDMSKKLASGDSRRFILQAFRGIGKSFITCAFVVWKLWNNPDLKIMIVSANKDRADANSVFIKRIIDLLPFLHELKPRKGQRDSSLSFDVGPAKPDHSPSVKSVGVTGGMTGSRADILIADDVEVPGNSGTQSARDHLGELVKEFDAILKPDGTIIYLGTPQTEMTLYRELEDRGYVTTIWPARYPRDLKDLESYWQPYKKDGDGRVTGDRSRLAPAMLAELEADPRLFWAPTDPVRFDEQDLRERELSYKKAGFALQFMLNPSLGDIEKYPLKLRDFIVAPLSLDTAPTTWQWLPNPNNEAKGLPMVGLKGDRYHNFESCGTTTSTYESKILVIDPSGRGKDETGYCVLYQLNGYIFLMEWGGFRGGYDDPTLEGLAKIGKKHKVNEVVIEGNFGDGMYVKLFSPVMTRIHPCTITEVKSKGQKELRICDTLEPVLANHRLVVADTVIEHDYRTAIGSDGTSDPAYSGFYQLTRISHERGAIAHDDRLDALAIGVAHFSESMEKDSERGAQEMLGDFLEKHLEDAMVGFNAAREISLGDGVEIRWDDDDGLSENFMGQW